MCALNDADSPKDVPLGVWLSVFGAKQMAQRKWRNSENNRLGLGLG